MTVYQVHHTCGHTSEQGAPDLDEDGFPDEVVLDRTVTTPCWPCRRGRYNEENDEAAAYADEQGWPQLEGSRKQIGWGQTLRRSGIEQATREVRSLYPGNEQLLALSTAILLAQTDARWWINQRFEIKKWPRFSWLGFFNRAHVYPAWVQAAAAQARGDLFEELKLDLDNVETHDELVEVHFRAERAERAGYLRTVQLQWLKDDMTRVRLRLDAEWGS